MGEFSFLSLHSESTILTLKKPIATPPLEMDVPKLYTYGYFSPCIYAAEIRCDVIVVKQEVYQIMLVVFICTETEMRYNVIVVKQEVYQIILVVSNK